MCLLLFPWVSEHRVLPRFVSYLEASCRSHTALFALLVTRRMTKTAQLVFHTGYNTSPIREDPHPTFPLRSSRYFPACRCHIASTQSFLSPFLLLPVSIRGFLAAVCECLAVKVVSYRVEHLMTRAQQALIILYMCVRCLNFHPPNESFRELLN